MTRSSIRLHLLTLLLLLSTAAVAAAARNILVIPKGTKASFWDNVVAGARQAGRDLELAITIRGPSTEDQHQAQSSIIDYGIANNYDAIVLAPNHEEYSAPLLEKAAAKGIKIVLIDSGMTSKHHASLIASDNGRAGGMAAEEIAKLLNRSGRVVLARHIKGHASTAEREEVFLATLFRHYPGITVVADPYVGASQGEAFHAISDLLENHPDIDGIFGVGEEVTNGILLALEHLSSEKRPQFIGFDFNEEIRLAILSRRMNATIVQNPYQIGYLGVTIANRLLDGEEVPEKVDTDLLLVTRDNINDTTVQAVLRQYLPQESNR